MGIGPRDEDVFGKGTPLCKAGLELIAAHSRLCWAVRITTSTLTVFARPTTEYERDSHSIADLPTTKNSFPHFENDSAHFMTRTEWEAVVSDIRIVTQPCVTIRSTHTGSQDL